MNEKVIIRGTKFNIEKGVTSNRWYAVPPYKKGENWKILNEGGEIVAWFEMREDCLKVVDTMNEKYA